MKRRASVSGVILAGGRSVRMGRDKAVATLGEQPLIARVHEVLASLFAEVLVVAKDPARYAFVPARPVTDTYAGDSPLVGLHAALAAAATDHVFVVGCDMPLLQAGLIRYLVDQRSGWDAVVPQVAGHYEPLHAVYARDCRVEIERALAAGARRMDSFFAAVRVKVVADAEIASHDPSFRSFRNINTPADLAAFPDGSRFA